METAQKPSWCPLALSAPGGRLVLNIRLEALCVCVCSRPYARVCVCSSNRMLGLHSKALPSPNRESRAPDCRGAGSDVTVCLCGEAGGREARQSVSESQPVRGWLHGGGGLLHAPEHVRACRSGGLQGEGGKAVPSLVLATPSLRTCSPTLHSWPLAPAHHLVPSPGLSTFSHFGLGQTVSLWPLISPPVLCIKTVSRVLPVLRSWGSETSHVCLPQKRPKGSSNSNGRFSICRAIYRK